MTSAPAPNSRPAEGLGGITLPSGWLLEEQIAAYQGQTGGNFCVGYRATKDGQHAFVKVVDVLSALRSPGDFVTALYDATAEVRSERAVLEICTQGRLSRVVQMLDNGQLKATAPAYAGTPLENVFYFVFELAASDVRKQLAIGDSTQVVWKLCVLSDVALAIDQLNRVGVAHQDIKPSNVLLMEPPSSNTIHKLGDFGRAVQRAAAGPHDADVFPGDVRYAPLSVDYGLREAEWTDGRTSTDLYMLGLMVAFMFSGVNLTTLQRNLTPDVLKGANWPGHFKEAIPHLIDIHARAIEQIKDSFPEPYRDELLRLVRELTHPDPCVRGDPRSRLKVGSPPGTDVYVSRFGAMAMRARLSRPA
jgi:serine/threonine protein kinase